MRLSCSASKQIIDNNIESWPPVALHKIEGVNLMQGRHLRGNAKKITGNLKMNRVNFHTNNLAWSNQR